MPPMHANPQELGCYRRTRLLIVNIRSTLTNLQIARRPIQSQGFILTIVVNDKTNRMNKRDGAHYNNHTWCGAETGDVKWSSMGTAKFYVPSIWDFFYSV